MNEIVKDSQDWANAFRTCHGEDVVLRHEIECSLSTSVFGHRGAPNTAVFVHQQNWGREGPPFREYVWVFCGLNENALQE